jgi:AcrR family transcriptional regulator
MAGTREIEAMTAEKLAAISMTLGSAPKIAVAPPPPPTAPRMLDDLAATIEAPTAPRLSLLDAAEAFIGDVGFDAATDEELARCAGVSVDVFHAHFANKNALLHALNERFCAQAIAVTDDATHSGIWEHATPPDVIEISVRSILDVVLGRAALVRAVLMSGDPLLLEGFRRVGTHMTEKVIRVLEETRVSAEEKPDPRDVAFAFLLAISLAHHAIMVGTEWSGVVFDREEIYERTTRAAMAYLDARPRPS